jgi:hypothetical protein
MTSFGKAAFVLERSVHLPESSAREVHSNRQAERILAIELTTAFA